MNLSVQGLVTAFSTDDVLPLTSPLSWGAGTFSLPDTVAQMTHTNNVSLSWSQGGSEASCSDPVDLNRDLWEERVLAARTLVLHEAKRSITNGVHDKMEWNIIKWTN